MSDTPFTLTREAVREFDRRAIDGFGIPGVVLMENAGRSCAELLRGLNIDKQPTIILCGPGNNGGDGFVIARHLDNHGWPVDVHVFAQNKELHAAGDADVFFDILFTAGIPFTQYHPDHTGERQLTLLRSRLSHPCWIVDALFGTGLSRPLRQPFSDIADMVNQSSRPVLAVDLPSGLDCDTGEPLGATIRADHTATFVAWKKGFLNPSAQAWTGEVYIIDIGAPRSLIEEYRYASQTLT